MIGFICILLYNVLLLACIIQQNCSYIYEATDVAKSRGKLPPLPYANCGLLQSKYIEAGA